MINIINKKNCCGCYGCINICPKKCIDMKIDNEGFWYPKVDINKCINCGLCEKVCPEIHNIKSSNIEIKAYACKNKNETIRLNSSSGGIFNILCEEVINKEGIVFGASFDKNFNVEHTYSDTLEGCNKFRGSKYVQSKIGNSYNEAKAFLDLGKFVLFSGTQCQIKGLNLFLQKEYEKLITVDIICHGVPSPKVFNLYKESLIKKYNGEIKKISFRDKIKGWKQFSYVTEFKDGQVHCETIAKDRYMKGFLKDIYLRPSCYSCKAKNYSSGSDISLADYWGIQNIHKDFDDDKGVSLVLVNTTKGKEAFKNIYEKIDFIESDLDFAVKNNRCIVKPVEYNKKREVFLKELNNGKIDIDRLIDKYSKVSSFKKAKGKVLSILVKIKKIIFKKYSKS